MTLYSTALDEMIRKAIDLTLDEDTLPGAVIALPIYGPGGELDALDADPNAATYTEANKQQRVLNAVAYFAAARLAPALPQITQEGLGDYRYAKEKWDAAAVTARLRGLANEEIAANTATDGEVEPLTGFWLACGTRGR